MTLPFQKMFPFSGGTLTPSLVAGNIRRIAADIQDSLDKRYHLSSFTLDFTGVADTDNQAVRSFVFASPFAYEIVGVEFEAYATPTITNLTLSLAEASLVGWRNVNVVPVSSTTRAHTAQDMSAQVGTAAATYLLAFTGTGTLTACRAIIHIRTDRGNAGSSHLGYVATDLPGTGDTTSETVLNTEFTALTAAAARDTANTTEMRIEVRSRRGILAGALPASDSKWTCLSATNKLISRIVSGVVCPVTSVIDTGYRSNNGTTVTNSTVTGNASTTAPNTTTNSVGGTPVNVTNHLGRPYIERISGTDAIPLAYSVLFYR